MISHLRDIISDLTPLYPSLSLACSYIAVALCHSTLQTRQLAMMTTSQIWAFGCQASSAMWRTHQARAIIQSDIRNAAQPKTTFKPLPLRPVLPRQGCAQVSLADFDPDTPSQKWYNILSFRCMRRDESSDESTVISSQTSTLTRNRGETSRFTLLYLRLHFFYRGEYGGLIAFCILVCISRKRICKCELFLCCNLCFISVPI